jgi:hypothetical protein
MRLLATILVIWPMTVFGLSSPDAVPPYGLWECKAEAGFRCNWKNQTRQPDCRLEDSATYEKSIHIDLRDKPFRAISPDADWEPSKLEYVGPEDGMWTLADAPMLVMGINPSEGKFYVFESAIIFGSYAIVAGICTNITPKESEKPTEDGGTPAED